MLKALLLADSFTTYGNSAMSTYLQAVIIQLKQHGYNVLAIRTNEVIEPWTHHPINDELLVQYCKAIMDFNPDLVVSINRAGLLPGFKRLVKEHVPIVNWFFDILSENVLSPESLIDRETYFATSTDTLDRFFAVCPSPGIKEKSWFLPWGASLLFLSQPVPRDLDVGFCGAAWSNSGFQNLLKLLSPFPSDLAIFLRVYEETRMHFNLPAEKRLRELGFAWDALKLKNSELYHLLNAEHVSVCIRLQISVEDRLNTLDVLSEFCTTIYGEPIEQWINYLSIRNSALLKKYKFAAIPTIHELAQFYRSIKIGLNVQHYDTRRGGSAFRAFDIIASGALLMTPPWSSSDLIEHGFKEGEDYVCYSDPKDLREKVSYFLTNEDHRQEITESAVIKMQSQHLLFHRINTIAEKAKIPELFLSIGNHNYINY